VQLHDTQVSIDQNNNRSQQRPLLYKSKPKIKQISSQSMLNAKMSESDC